MGHAVDFSKRSVLTLPHAPKEIYANAKIAVDAPVSLHPLQGPGKAIYAIYALCCHNVMLNGIFLNVKKKKKNGSAIDEIRIFHTFVFVIDVKSRWPTSD